MGRISESLFHFGTVKGNKIEKKTAKGQNGTAVGTARRQHEAVGPTNGRRLGSYLTRCRGERVRSVGRLVVDAAPSSVSVPFRVNYAETVRQQHSAKPTYCWSADEEHIAFRNNLSSVRSHDPRAMEVGRPRFGAPVKVQRRRAEKWMYPTDRHGDTRDGRRFGVRCWTDVRRSRSRRCGGGSVKTRRGKEEKIIHNDNWSDPSGVVGSEQRSAGGWTGTTATVATRRVAYVR